MLKFEAKHFKIFNFTPEQVEANMKNAEKTLEIAGKDRISEVIFDYSYKAIIKAGIALLSKNNCKVKSGSGHHIKVIEALAKILDDKTIGQDADVMRGKRNLDFYCGGIEVSEKEAAEYLAFAKKIVLAARKIIG
ncbi:MAG: hypothetical protein NTZ10_03280 [Candidatus Saganbacteria bacterium]|nr:hypothetical protein [Candidatus Saganbacteria bacterium]